jgi:hypothetical protein
MFTGEFPKAWAYIIAHYGVGKAMMIPQINEWLTKVTPADVAILEKLYEGNPTGKAAAQSAIVDVLSKAGKPTKIRALMNFLTKPQVKAIIKATTSLGAASKADEARKDSEKPDAEETPSTEEDDQSQSPTSENLPRGGLHHPPGIWGDLQELLAARNG